MEWNKKTLACALYAEMGSQLHVLVGRRLPLGEGRRW